MAGLFACFRRGILAAMFFCLAALSGAQTPKATTPPPRKGGAEISKPNPVERPTASRPVAVTPRPSTPLDLPYTPAQRADGRHVVALDIGHTVLQHGSTSARGEGEFYFNQRIVRLLAARLEKSTLVFPIVINPEGAKIGLLDRSRLAAKHGAELFLSVHHDAANQKYIQTWDPKGDGKKQQYSDQFRGYGVFISKKSRAADRSLQFATLLGEKMRERGFVFTPHHNEPIRGENRPILDQERGVYQYDDLIVLKHSPMPAALLECGVIIHRDEELKLKKPETQARIAEAAASAIEAFFRR